MSEKPTPTRDQIARAIRWHQIECEHVSKPKLEWLVYAARQYLASLDASAPSVDWHPIESAPKDGTQIFVTYNPNGRQAYRVVRWRFDCWCSVPADWRVEPTHWMPLPTAPSASDAGPVNADDGSPKDGTREPQDRAGDLLASLRTTEAQRDAAIAKVEELETSLMELAAYSQPAPPVPQEGDDITPEAVAQLQAESDKVMSKGNWRQIDPPVPQEGVSDEMVSVALTAFDSGPKDGQRIEENMRLALEPAIAPLLARIKELERELGLAITERWAERARVEELEGENARLREWKREHEHELGVTVFERAVAAEARIKELEDQYDMALAVQLGRKLQAAQARVNELEELILDARWYVRGCNDELYKSIQAALPAIAAAEKGA